MVKDPVCGMTINQQANVITTQYQGKTYYFCSQMCKMMFEREPEKYVAVEVRISSPLNPKESTHGN